MSLLKKFSLLFTAVLSSCTGTKALQQSFVKHPAWSKNVGIYEVNIRQYTPEGTFKAFEKHLPELKELGVGILWLMPINPIGIKNRKGKLGSYYSVKNYKKVNHEFGTLEDFKGLVNKIHKMGMHVIIDWVANHTAWDNVWVTEHPEFYTKDANGNFVPPVADWSDVIDLNYNNKLLWKYMVDAMKYWVTETNIDGFRCDVAAMVPTEFWNYARKQLDEIKPVFMLAEANEPELQIHAFDMTYNWQLKDLMNKIAKRKAAAEDIAKLYSKQQKKYSPNDYRMNFTTNHDENTWNGTVYERLGNGAECFSVLTFMLPGMPLLYSGQEYGLNKRLRFFDKDTIKIKKGRLFSLYSKLYKLKRENKVLRNGLKGGKIKFVKNNNPKNIIVFTRKNGKSGFLSIFNLSDKKSEVSILNKKIFGIYQNIFTDKKLKMLKKTKLKLKPWEYLILRFQ